MDLCVDRKSSNCTMVARVFVLPLLISDHFVRSCLSLTFEWNICKSVAEIHIKLLNISCGFMHTLLCCPQFMEATEVVGKSQNSQRNSKLTKEVG